eukprot:TRINITY_DN17692_c0_g1_i4.p1 TRINITY_DN17692_c0_g1~~TRINITY_DN17692_c0_g1_i4.p1  ORF type:complete len:187 (+),score=51.23 TRINITY_DN17692_c0_g1_i4:129-689(+)
MQALRLVCKAPQRMAGLRVLPTLRYTPVVVRMTSRRMYSTTPQPPAAKPATPPPPPPPAAASGPPPPPPDFSKYNHVPKTTPEELLSFMIIGQNVTILDIRPEEEFQSAHVTGAVSGPLASLESLGTKLQRQPIFIYGTKQRGYEPQCQAQMVLAKQGHKACVIEGDVKDMVKAGFFYEAEKDTIF